MYMDGGELSAKMGGSPRPSSFLVAVREKEAVVLEGGGRPALSAGVAALGRLLWAFKKPARLCRKNGSRVCGRGLGGEVEADPPAFAVRRRRRRVGGGVQPGASAGRRGCRRLAGAAGLEAGGRDLVLLGSYLELEGAQAALDDHVRAVLERRERRHVAAAADPDAIRGPQVWRQVLWQLSVYCKVVARQRRIV
jgi:hypothetical protein